MRGAALWLFLWPLAAGSADDADISTKATTTNTTLDVLRVVDDLIHKTDAVGSHVELEDKNIVVIVNNKNEGPMHTDFDAPDAPELDSFSSSQKERLISTGLLMLLSIIMFSWLVGMCCRRLRLSFVTVPLIATFCGLLIGLCLKYSRSGDAEDKTLLQRILALNEDFFFMTILPPIIFDSGFSLRGAKAKAFFDNFGTVLWFALLTTFISFVMVGVLMYFAGLLDFLGGAWSVREAFAFGALISATDPVSVLSLFRANNVVPLLETLVSGESLLNDALSIVLYRTITHSEGPSLLAPTLHFFFVVVYSISIGVAVGLASAVLARYTSWAGDERDSIEFSALILFPWVSYLLSDGSGNSGIVSILFCAIVMAQYTTPLLSSVVQESASAISASFCLFAESMAFVFLGLGEFSLRQSMLSVPLVLTTLVVVSLSRVVSVYITTMAVNSFRRTNPVTKNIAAALVVSGLRGSCAFALAMHARHDFGGSAGSAIVSATLVFSIFTIVVVGPVSYPLFKAWGVFLTPEKRRQILLEEEAAAAVAHVTFFDKGKLVLMRIDDILRSRLLPPSDASRSDAFKHPSHSTSEIVPRSGAALGRAYDEVTIELR